MSPSKSTLASRVREILDEHPRLQGHGGQTELSNIAGASKGLVNQWLDGKIRSINIDFALNIENTLGYNHVWLMVGSGPKYINNAAEPPTNAELVAQHPGTPVLTWEAAANWPSSRADLTLRDTVFLPERSTLGHLGDNGYVLAVKDHAMVAGATVLPSFPPGMKLYVNADLAPVPGQFVIVKRASGPEAVFRRLTEIDGARYLEALNESWPARFSPWRDDDECRGVVMACGEVFVTE